MPAPFIVRQVTGPGRAIVLRGRALPFRGGEWESEMSVDIQWYPGNPVANSQVIGFREMPSIFNGRWSDKLLGDPLSVEGVRLLNFPAVSPVGLPTAGINAGSTFAAPSAFPVASQKAQLAQTVFDAFDLVLREGQKLKVEWGTRVRYGFLARIKDAPARGNDIEWELEFRWTGRSNQLPFRILPKVNLLSTSAGLQKLLDGLLASMAKLQGLPAPPPGAPGLGILALLSKGTGFVDGIAGKIVGLAQSIASLLSSLQGLTSLRFAPANLLSTIKAALQLIKSIVADLRRDLAKNRGAAQEAAAIGLPSAVAVAKMAQAAFRKQITDIAAFAAEQQRLLDQIETTEVLASFTAPEQITLRDVSSRFYGTPNQWVKIAEFNAFAGSTVSAGTTILVPKLS